MIKENIVLSLYERRNDTVNLQKDQSNYQSTLHLRNFLGLEVYIICTPAGIFMRFFLLARITCDCSLRCAWHFELVPSKTLYYSLLNNSAP